MKSLQSFLLGGALAISIAAPALADPKSDGDAAAIAEWRPLAIAGDADAQVRMGEAYQLGRGVPVDLKLAEDWFRRAAQLGSTDGKDGYGLILFRNGKRAEALPYIEDAAGRGNPRAQYVLGTALFNGDMIAKDWPRAYAMMLRATAAGISAAKASLTQMDKFIPIDQRNRGTALAGAFEAHANAQIASSGKPAQRPIVTNEDLPPSISPQPVSAKPAPTVPKPALSKPTIVKSIPKPVPPLPVAVPGGKWRIQLGAFADASSAHALWPSLRARIPALAGYQAFVIKAGSVTRLQAGPLASNASASQLCAAVRAAKQACVPVAP
ncbi:hypothetical protein BH09PSE3_BH09PSE3_11710 [soil metagenome]